MERIEIMPKMEGTGRAGTSELLSVASPLVAALSLTPVGRGIGMAFGTIAMAPQESEAGILTSLSKLSKLPAKITSRGMSVFPDQLLVHEIPTNHWSRNMKNVSMKEQIQKLRPGTTKYIESETARVNLSNTMGDIKKAKFVPINERVAKVWDVDDTTQGIYGHKEANYPNGVVGIRLNIDDNAKATTMAHEYTHLSDESSPFTRDIFNNSDRDMPYHQRIHEVKAFIAGSRAHLPSTMTNPTADDFIHPLISYTDGIFSNKPLDNYFKGMQAGNYKYNMDEIHAYTNVLNKEIDRLTAKAKEFPAFRERLDEAFREMPDHYEGWIYNENQVRKRTRRQIAEDKATVDNLLEGII